MCERVFRFIALLLLVQIDMTLRRRRCIVLYTSTYNVQLTRFWCFPLWCRNERDCVLRQPSEGGTTTKFCFVDVFNTPQPGVVAEVFGSLKNMWCMSELVCMCDVSLSLYGKMWCVYVCSLFSALLKSIYIYVQTHLQVPLFIMWWIHGVCASK